jgi:hypothetical protein
MRTSGTIKTRPALRVAVASSPVRPAASQRPRLALRKHASESSRNSDSLYTAWKTRAVGNSEMKTTLQRAGAAPKSSHTRRYNRIMAPA